MTDLLILAAIATVFILPLLINRGGVNPLFFYWALIPQFGAFIYTYSVAYELWMAIYLASMAYTIFYIGVHYAIKKIMTVDFLTQLHAEAINLKNKRSG